MAQTLDDYAHDIGERLASGLRDRGVDPAQLPNPAEAAALLLDMAAAPAGDRLAELAGPVWTGSKVQAELGLNSRQALEYRRKSGSVLGVKTADGMVLYPILQFYRTAGGTAVKPGIASMFRVLCEIDPWSVLVLLHTPAEELGGSTPLEWERHHRGEADSLVELARAFAAEWNRP